MTTSTLPQQITELYERDQRLQPMAVAPTDVPTRYAAITPEWMTHFLCKGHPAARVTGVTLGPADDGSTNRRRLFLEYNQAGRDASLPASVFCKGAFDLINRMNMGLCGAAHGEVTFFGKIRHLLDIDAPRAYHAAMDNRSFVYITVFEDLTGKVEFCTHATPINYDRAASMVCLMANYHAAMAGHPGISARGFGLPTFQEFWRTIENLVFMEKSSNDGFLACEKEIPARLYARFPEIYPATRRAVALHDNLPHTLIHSDVHLKNWYVRGGNDMGLPDWHCCASGNWSRDFAYAMSVALTPENRRLWEQDLLRLYLSEVQARGGPGADFDTAWSLYRQQLFTALAFWTNTLCPTEMQPANMQPQDTAREFIRRVATAIDDLDALA